MSGASLRHGIIALLAVICAGTSVGVATVVEALRSSPMASYGVTREMYVAPDHRSAVVRTQHVAEVLSLARARGWTRVDATAPDAAPWQRTGRFHEAHGFVSTGPRLKFVLARQDMSITKEAYQ